MTLVAEERAAAEAAFGQLVPPVWAAGSWIEALRREAYSRYAEQGLPTTRDEEWRQTSVAPIARVAWAHPPRSGHLDAGFIASTIGQARGPLAVFVDGRFSREMSSPSALPGVDIVSLQEPRGCEAEGASTHLGRVAAATAFGDLNTAHFQDGALVTVAPGFEAPEPIQLVFVSSRGEGKPFVTHPRVLLLAGRGSEATVIETHASLDGIVSLTNAVTEIVLGDGARLAHYRMQREGRAAFHVGALAARLGWDSVFRSVTVSLGAALSRLDLTVRFDAPGGDATLDGLFMADGTRHTDIHTRVLHAVPHCASRQLYKGILDGSARGVFSGIIVVEKGAQKTDSAQVNRNLLLSRGALVHSTPQLLIRADDVKCKHGSTTGQIDPAALFYLRSRDVGEATARSLLTYAFASEIVHRIGIESLRAGLDTEIAALLDDASVIREAFA